MPLCWEIAAPPTVHHVAPHSTSRVAKPPSLMRPYRIRLSPPMTHKADVLLACEAEEPAIYLTVYPRPADGDAPELRSPSPYLDTPIEPDLGFERQPAGRIPPAEGPFFTSYTPMPPILPPVIASPGVIPEPSSWVMMILGMGLVGAVMRRARQAYG